MPNELAQVSEKNTKTLWTPRDVKSNRSISSNAKLAFSP